MVGMKESFAPREATFLEDVAFASEEVESNTDFGTIVLSCGEETGDDFVDFDTASVVAKIELPCDFSLIELIWFSISATASSRCVSTLDGLVVTTISL